MNGEFRGSQFGEDRWLFDHYRFDTPGIFVDVGASDGVNGSNSLLFENLGWWCLCIEPDPRHWDHLVATRRNCLAMAVSTVTGTATLWLHPQRPSRSSLVPSEPVLYAPIEVSTISLTSLVDHYGLKKIDVLDIDVEGHELAAWSSLDLGMMRPSLVLIEYANSRPNSSFAAIHNRFDRDQYSLVHQTSANLIFECQLDPPVRRTTNG